MHFLLDKRGTNVVEWLVAAVAVIFVVGTVVLTIANTTATEGDKTNTWIDALPDP